jgi:SAM-dependent methyltransferase
MTLPIAWPSTCYPPAIMNAYPFVRYAPGVRALRGLLPRYLRPGLRVLDIGCGRGIGACHIAASGGLDVAYQGIDPDPVACRHARDILSTLPTERIRGAISPRTVQEHLDTAPSPVDLILWTFAFHDCVDVVEEEADAVVCAAVTALLPPGGHLIMMDAGFAPGVSADEVERTYAHMERIIGHQDRGRYFPPPMIERLFTGAGLALIEHHDVPLVALARYLDLPHARAILSVFAK